jgi:hypothetical protein
MYNNDHVFCKLEKTPIIRSKLAYQAREIVGNSTTSGYKLHEAPKPLEIIT